MLFRPEEVHRTSRIRGILKPLPEGDGHVPNQVLRFCSQDNPVSDFHLYGFSTIQARGIDLDCFAREKPADRQRFKSSLAKPFLLTIDGNAILRREVVEGSEGRNEIGIGEEPSRNPSSEKFMESFSPYLYRDSKLGCDLRVMGGLASLHHTAHDDMKGSIKIAGLTHGLSS
jgi:hypothetical protein